jgi:hypothetical protein
MKNITTDSATSLFAKRGLHYLCMASLLTAGLYAHRTEAEPAPDVFLNGVLLTTEQVVLLETLGGERIASGHYWVNLATGESGYGDEQPVTTPATTPEASSPFTEDRIADSITSMGYSIPDGLVSTISY